MSTQNLFPFGNSGSLEDCHTNLYELTDIAGIQYKKFIYTKDSLINSLEDPILSLYTKCVQSGILCSWKLMRKDDRFSQLSDYTAFKRELWVFWYDGNDPFSMKNITIPNSVKEDEKGNWKNGLNYEIRSILFKSLSMYFQRYFLRKGYVRLGPWHQLPYRTDKTSECQYGFNIKLFLHGESTICGAIDVRNVAVVRQISCCDINEFSVNNKKVEVLLAPYGVKAHLTGKSYRDDDPEIGKVYDEWLKYYPLMYPQKSDLKSKRFKNILPKFVEVIVGNYSMKYPTCFICIQMKEKIDPDKLTDKINRKRKINEITSPISSSYSFVGGRISDKMMRETMIPLANNLKKGASRKLWKYTTPYWRSSCKCQDKKTTCNHDLMNTSSKTFHQRLEHNENSDHSTHRATLIIENNCDRNMSPPTLNTSTNPNDPIMPTLSPQMPQTSDNNNVNTNHKLIPNSNGNNNQPNSEQNSILPITSVQNNINFHIRITENNENQNNSNFTNSTNSNFKISKSLVNGINHNTVNSTLNVTNSINTSIISVTPPPPSITPTATGLPQNIQPHKSEQISNGEFMVKSESFENNSEKKFLETLPLGLELKNKPVLSNNLFVPNISLVNKSYNRKSLLTPSLSTLTSTPTIHASTAASMSLTNAISDVPLCPVIESCLVMNDFKFQNINDSNNNKSSTFNFGIVDPNKEPIPSNSFLNNSWLSLDSYNDNINTDGAPISKKLKMHLYNQTKTEYNYQDSNGMGSNFTKSANNCTNNCRSSSSDVQKQVNLNISNEKIEQTVNIPEQIFDDSDDDDPNTKNESNEAYNINKPYFNNEKILSPNSSHMKMLRSKFGGNSMNSSTGSGGVSGTELSLMYPTPPSLEGALITIGSPIERQTTNTTGTTVCSNSSSSCNTNGNNSNNNSLPTTNHNISNMGNSFSSSNNIYSTINCENTNGNLPSSLLLKSIIANNSNSTKFSESHDVLKNLTLSGQNWEEIAKDWERPVVNVDLFSSGSKYTKDVTSQLNYQTHSNSMSSLIPVSFNHRQYQHQINKMEAQKRAKLAAAAMYNQVVRRPTTLYYSQAYPVSQMFNIPPPKPQSSAPITPGSACTNPPSVDSSSGTPQPRQLIASTPNTQQQMVIHHYNSYHPGHQPQHLLHHHHNHTSPLTTVRSPRTIQHHLPVTSTAGSFTNTFQPHTTIIQNSLPTINSLYFNVLLSDSILDIYRDHNFDSCNICVCSMSVTGNDIGLYIEDNNNAGFNQSQQNPMNRSTSQDDLNNMMVGGSVGGISGNGLSKTDCKCGFSAIINRHYAANSNLFYEDEIDVTGLRRQLNYNFQSIASKDKLDTNSRYTAVHLLSVYNEFGLGFLYDSIRYNEIRSRNDCSENLVEFQDFNCAVTRALEQSVEQKNNDNSWNNRATNNDKDKIWLSNLCYLKKSAPIPKNYNDQIRLLMALRPLLQEAVSNTRHLESSCMVDGPLTWKTFHRLAGRGNLESCEPQPLPRFQMYIGRQPIKENYSNIPGLKAMKSSSQPSTSNSQFSNILYQNMSNGLIPNQNSPNQINKKTNILKNFSLDGNPLCLQDGYPDREKECITVSPYAIREWEKLNFEPMYKPKEIAYAVVASTDSEQFMQKLLVNFFKELNKTYQNSRLGHHFSYRCERNRDDIQNSFIEINTDIWNENPEKLTMQPSSTHKYWVSELSEYLIESQAEDLISRILWYENQCRQQTIRFLLQYGINRRNGTRSVLFPTSSSNNSTNNNYDKYDTECLNQSLELLLSPGNGCGPQSRTLNTDSWSSEKDVYLVIYIVNPFTQNHESCAPLHRLTVQILNRLCDNIRDGLPPIWRSRLTFQLIDSSRLTRSSCHSNPSPSGLLPFLSQNHGILSYQSTALSIYSSVRRKVLRVAGLHALLNCNSTTPITSTSMSSSNQVLCPASPRCTVGRACSPHPYSAASIINANRALTRSGPAAINQQITTDFLRNLILKSSDIDMNQLSITIYSPSFILAPPRSIGYEAASFQNQPSSTPLAPPPASNNNSNPLSNIGGHNSFTSRGFSSSSNNNNTNDPEFWGRVGDKSGVMFVTYCLSHDQHYLLATCSDERGTMLRQIQINISVPQMHLRKRASPRRIGLAKLWDFIVELAAETCQPWRLVIGRLGRAGHGELKGWNGLLSRLNLDSTNQRFRDECQACRVWSASTANNNHNPNSNGMSASNNSGSNQSVGRCDLCANEIPTFVSGCFVSLEANPGFRIFPGSVKFEERHSSNLQLSTPKDIGVTHILVFPTSTSAGAIQNDQELSGSGMVNLEELLEIRFGTEELAQMDMSDNIGFPPGFDSGFGALLGGSGSVGVGGVGGRNNTGVGGNINVGSMSGNCGVANGVGNNNGSLVGCNNDFTGLSGNGGGQGSIVNGENASGTNGGSSQPVLSTAYQAQDEGHLLLMQQPLAMGYYVSTTAPGPLPNWFWPEPYFPNLPSCFKAALHLQTSLTGPEDSAGGGCLYGGSIGPSPHPLDSHQTCDVLHFVLDQYHAMSWLTFDPAINERRSCLPIHILCLAQLYQADNIFM